MWKAVNLSEVPIKIKQFGKDVIVPYDRTIRTFEDDSVFDEVKSLFKILQSPPKNTFVDNTMRAEIEGKIKPLQNTRIKKEVREDLVSANVRRKPWAKGRKKKYSWTFISPSGNVHCDVDLPSFAKEHFNVDYRALYAYANKTYKGWRIKKDKIGDN